ncbi:hypothetical protein F383_19772 [Gossypium arboreum]|uniref:Uncharacterized protein n=1 Tax=Gossypium arboreum TaxID=29729 RepID=A0A0B0NQ44_GOSAR|nr:hypothetical protein F383_19772 [Gossypium arboreum]
MVLLAHINQNPMS